MKGLSAATGREINGVEHLRQSIADVLFTPLGSRVMRRDYGSLLTELLDAPVNRSTTLKLYAATAMAIMRWEPRLILRRVSLAKGDAPGAFTLVLEGDRTDVPAPNAYARLTFPLRASPATRQLALA